MSNNQERLAKSVRDASRSVIFLSAIFYTLTGLVLIFVPQWSYDTFANYPPFNRHFLGDAGSFALPIGLGLFVAWRNPYQYRGIIGIAAGVSLVHALNHTYDAIVDGATFVEWLDLTTAAIPLLILAGLLIVAYRSFSKARL